MSNLISVDDFSPLKIKSGDSIEVKFRYSADAPNFIVVNEGSNFDATPGKIKVKAGTDLTKRATITITRQPGAPNTECTLRFTLHPSSHTILVGIK